MAYVVTNPTTVQVLERAAQATYQGHSAIAIHLLTANGLSFDDLRSYLIAKGGMPSLQGLGVAAPAPVPVAATTPVDTSAEPIDQQLSQIRMDWSSGTLYVGSNHYSLLTTLLGGLVIKGIMWGGSKVFTKAAPSPLVLAEQGGRAKARKNPFLFGLLPKLATGGTYAVGEYGVKKVLPPVKKRSKRRRS